MRQPPHAADLPYTTHPTTSPTIFQHRSLPTTQVRLHLQMQQWFMVGVHYSALAIQVATPPLTSLVDGKEFFVNNGPVAFRWRVF